MVQYLNNLDTEDLIFTNLLVRSDLEGLDSSILQNASSPTSLRILTHYKRWETSYSKQRSSNGCPSSKLPYLTTLCLQINIIEMHHRTRDFKVGSALLVGLAAGSGAFFAVHGRLHEVGYFGKIVHFEMILPVSRWR